MNRQKASLAIMGASALIFAIILSIGLPANVSAQAPTGQKQQTPTPGRQQNPSDPSGLKGLMSGLNVGPLMMSFGGAYGGMIDFTRSNERVLIERSDVRSELFIDSKQRELLSDLDQKNNQQLQVKMVQTVLQNTINNPDFKAISQLGNGQKPNPGVIQDVLNSSFQAMQDGLQSFQATADANEEALLKPDQLVRLRELDLQWRGLLALSDKKVAEELKVTTEQKAVVDSALKAYQATQMEVFEPLMSQAMQFSQQAANSRSAPRTFDQDEVKRTLAAAMESDTMKKARTSAEAKVRAALTTDQLAQWKKMTGKKFYFIRLD